MTRFVMHVDLDASYAAIEQRDRPEWRGLRHLDGAERRQVHIRDASGKRFA